MLVDRWNLKLLVNALCSCTDLIVLDMVILKLWLIFNWNICERTVIIHHWRWSRIMIFFSKFQWTLIQENVKVLFFYKGTCILSKLLLIQSLSGQKIASHFSFSLFFFFFPFWKILQFNGSATSSQIPDWQSVILAALIKSNRPSLSRRISKPVQGGHCRRSASSLDLIFSLIINFINVIDN